MSDPGQKLKRKRESLGLKYRDVEEASNLIATSKKSDEFIINLSRLSDIENKGTVPSIFRLYSLCTIYRVDLVEVLDWYGVTLSTQPADSRMVSISKTHAIGFPAPSWGDVQMPLSLEPGIDLTKTTLLSRMIQRWGKMSISLLGNLELKHLRYAFIGSEDWRMFPLIYPESLILIDETQKKIANSGWNSEYDRPIYFLEHRTGYFAGWCSVVEKTLVVLAHPASFSTPLVFAVDETDILGQVTGTANYFESGKRPPHSS